MGKQWKQWLTIFLGSKITADGDCSHEIIRYLDFPGGSDSKASAYNAGDPGLIPGLGRSPGDGNGNPLQYYCLENPMDRGAWQATVHGVSKSWTQLCNFTFTSLTPWKESYDQPRQHIKSRDITLPKKVRLVKVMVFPVVMYGCESWTVKKAEHRRIDAFELWCWRSLLSFKEIQTVHPKGDQSWVFTGRTDVEVETPILWPPDTKS